MSSVTVNTPSTNINVMLSIPAMNSLNKKTASLKKNIAYVFVPKHISRKPASKIFSIDWDLNMNELEFE